MQNTITKKLIKHLDRVYLVVNLVFSGTYTSQVLEKIDSKVAKLSRLLIDQPKESKLIKSLQTLKNRIEYEKRNGCINLFRH